MKKSEIEKLKKKWQEERRESIQKELLGEGYISVKELREKIEKIPVEHWRGLQHPPEERPLIPKNEVIDLLKSNPK